MHPSTSVSAVRSALRSKRLWFFIVLAVVIGLALKHFLQSEDEAPSYQTATVTRGNIEDSIGSLGSLEPKEYVDVGTQVSGQLQRLLVDIGDQVEEGQLLAEIDPTVFESRVRNSRATLTQLQAQLALQKAEQTLALRRLERNRALFAERAVSEDVLLASETEVEANRARLESLAAQIDAAQASLEGDLANLGYTKIYAPMSGTVVDVSAIQGQTINASQTAPTIVRIANLDVMTVRAQVSEADVIRIREGMPVYFTTLGMPERRWRATVRQVLPTPQVLNNVVLYNVLIDVDNQDRALMTSMTAQVFFLLAEAQDVLVIPADALRGRGRPAAADGAPRNGNGREGAPRENGARAGTVPAGAPREDAPQEGAPSGQRPAGGRNRAMVEVLTPRGPELREVQVGVRSRTAVEIRSGLQEGEEVITGRTLAGSAAPGSRGLLDMGPRRR